MNDWNTIFFVAVGSLLWLTTLVVLIKIRWDDARNRASRRQHGTLGMIDQSARLCHQQDICFLARQVPREIEDRFCFARVIQTDPFSGTFGRDLQC